MAWVTGCDGCSSGLEIDEATFENKTIEAYLAILSFVLAKFAIVSDQSRASARDSGSVFSKCLSSAALSVGNGWERASEVISIL